MVGSKLQKRNQNQNFTGKIYRQKTNQKNENYK